MTRGLACLVANQEFSLVEADLVTDALAEMVAAVTRVKDHEQRLKKLEREVKAKSKKAPLVSLREAS
jgi:hypothetical protein